MFIVVQEGRMNSIRSVVGHPIDDYTVQVLDTDDCVVEKYSWTELKEIAKNLTIVGVDLSNDSVVIGHAIKELLRGRLSLEPTGFCYFDNRVVFKIRMSGNWLRLVDSNGSDILLIQLKKKPLHFRTCLRYAEKVGKYYKVVVSLDMNLSHSPNVVEQIAISFIFSDTGFEGLYNCDYKKGNIVSIMRISSYEISSSLRARLNLKEALE